MNILNRKNYIIFLLAGFIIAFVLVGSAISATISDLTYPVADLGNCASQQECKVYCGTASNYSQCAEFADKNNLKVEVPDDKKAVFAAMQKGESPGQCKDEASCRNYCEDIDHIEECVNFVEKFNLASGDELKEIRQMADVKKSGVAFPGNCQTKESCLKYCDNSANAVVCMEFALKAGFIPKEDAEAVGKIIPFLKSGGKLPGGCTRKESCDAYCESDTHTNECMDFAVEAGFMTKEEGETIKRTGGKGPGNCRSKEACENYCNDAAHIDECIDFAVRAGFISKEDAEMAKKFKITSGPGGCKGKAECESFCITNQEVCIKWGKEHGMDIGEQGEHGTDECVKQGGTPDGTTCKFPEGQFPGIECENPPCGPPDGGFPGGPVRCGTEENPEECQQLEPPHQGGGGGPGGCKTPDECQAYCQANPDACRGSGPTDGGGPGYQGEQPSNFDNAAAECGKQGGSWEGDKCYFRDPTMQNQGVDNAGSECSKQGGNWTGSSCNFPPPPEPPSSFLNHPFLGAMLRYLLK